MARGRKVNFRWLMFYLGAPGVVHARVGQNLLVCDVS